MAAVRLIVCERQPRWAVSLRNALQDHAPEIVETRSLAGSLAALEKSPASLVLVDVSGDNLQAVLEWLDAAGRRFPLARLLAALAPELAGFEPVLREAGAIDVRYFSHEAPAVARLARRQLALTHEEQLDPRQWVAQRMPWPAYASSTV